ncbi:LPD1 domain-containing protein [Paenibacillus periandrae]|uniref:LPD1 domain-containing protein n=1 Tax=Paenibacillus periandrae TaxID=1761741 RepID=UPI001F09E388|nr:LPD1 domain-containing protein [Paenibacillus periandrae]
MNVRIHTLKKDEVFKQQFLQYGISELVAEVKFSVSPGDSYYEQMKKFESAIKRKVKSTFFGLCFEEKIQFIQDISFGPYKIEVQLMKAFETEEDKTILNILCSAGKIVNKPEIYEQYLPAKMTITRGGIVSTAYSLLNKELPEKYHFAKYGWRQNMKKIGSFMFVDCLRLLTMNISFNTLSQFTEKQSDYIRYKITDYYSQESVKWNKPVLPEDEAFAAMVIQEINKYKLPFVERGVILKVNQYSFEEFSLQKEDDIPVILNSKHGKGIVIPRFIRTMCYVRDKTERMLEEHSTYAKAFQDKKNVTLKVKSVMQKNEFLTRYGKVELDTDVDLDRFRSLEKEFEVLKKSVHIPLARDYSFRIRKLGKHRAAGLHYAFYRATIIDIEHPSSYMHELGHQLDYTMNDNNMLSEMMSFLRIIQLYEEIANENVSRLPSNDPFVITWFGKTKFNRDYYFQPTEVFARSFELYLTKCKKIESSFLKENYDSPIYPSDATYLEVIQTYFDDLFASCEPVDESTKEQSFKLGPLIASNSIVEERIYPIFKNGQLCLF